MFQLVLPTADDDRFRQRRAPARCPAFAAGVF